MKVIERLTAAEIQLRLHHGSTLRHETALSNSNTRALPRATLLSASSENKILLAASSTTVFTTPFHRSHFLASAV